MTYKVLLVSLIKMFTHYYIYGHVVFILLTFNLLLIFEINFLFNYCYFSIYSMTSRADQNNQWASYAKPGGWNGT